jgi:hypothetical protein
MFLFMQVAAIMPYQPMSLAIGRSVPSLVNGCTVLSSSTTAVLFVPAGNTTGSNPTTSSTTNVANTAVPACPLTENALRARLDVY